MKSVLVAGRNGLLKQAYSRILKPFLFRRDPEIVHDRMVRLGQTIGRTGAGRRLTSMIFGYVSPVLEQHIEGMTFKNPIGLSAGFDKNAELTDIIPSVGFGFAELGSITGEVCAGNPKPRLWRLPRSKSLAVWYGLKNDGCEAISERLQGRRFAIPMGVSVAMTNCAENADINRGIRDFAKAFRTMEPVADYLTVNISCPNTLGGQPFIDPANFNKLFEVLDLIPTTKPIFIKLSPDLTLEQLEALLVVAERHRVHGIICTNLTKKKDNPKIVDDEVPPKGGLSGKIVQEMSDGILRYIYTRKGKKFILIGCGGVFTAEDAYKKIRSGASLVQMITGMIFEGPQVASEINRGLVRLLERDGFRNVNEAIGADAGDVGTTHLQGTRS